MCSICIIVRQICLKVATILKTHYRQPMKKIHQIHKVCSVLIVLTALFLLNTSCSSSAPNGASKTEETVKSAVQKQESETSVMVFNVENLFDTEHDAGTEDYANLPLSEKSKPEIKKFCSEMKNEFYKMECFEKDWNKDILKFKLGQLAKVIRHIDQGKGPDTLLLAEVENQKVLDMLFKEELKDLGYQTVILLEGPDLRGIDPAFASKFPMKGKPQLHLVPYKESNPEKLKWAKRSRGILEVTVTLPNKKDITFLVGHFPSQSNPTEWRKQAVEFSTELMKKYESQGRAVIMGGDLNIIDTEETDFGYFSKIFSTAGQVSHLVGCKSCAGTHNYKGHWSFLDVMIYGNGLIKNGFELIPDSLQVVKVSHHMKRNGAPLDFKETEKEGVSDHFPLYSRLKISTTTEPQKSKKLK